ncbi:MAG: glycoside hydrolase family 30 beta sandwich domain-containing protein [Sphingobium sp.]
MSLRLLLLGLMSVLTLASAGCSAEPGATVTVNPAQTFQTMEAWEVTPKMWDFDKKNNRFNGSWLPIRDQILTRMIEEGGINRIRLELRSGAENPVDYWPAFRAGKLSYIDFKAHFYEKINDNDDPRVLNPKGVQFTEFDFRVENFLLPAMRIAKQLGRPMTYTLCYIDFGWTPLKGTLSHARQPEEYAELIAATYAHMKEKYGLVPAELEIILEPDNSDEWRGKQIGEAIMAVSKRLGEQGIAPRIIAPSTASGGKTMRYFDDLASVPGAAQKVSVVSYHRYGSALTDDVLAQIKRRADKFGAKTAMLEFTHGDIDDLFDDLTKANVSSWQKYSIVKRGADDGTAPGNLMVANQPEQRDPQIRIKASTLAMTDIFRSVFPGAVRIGARSDQSSIDTVAFRNPDGRIVVSVKANPGVIERTLKKVQDKVDLPNLTPSPSGGQWVGITGLRAGRYEVMRANAVVGGERRCSVIVSPAMPPAVYLRSRDVATLVEQAQGTAPTTPACSRNPADWK